MISMTNMNRLSRALPQCDLTLSSGNLLILDRHTEIIGRVDLETGCLFIFDNYEYKSKVRKRLKRAGIPNKLEDLAAGAMKVLYDEPIL